MTQHFFIIVTNLIGIHLQYNCPALMRKTLTSNEFYIHGSVHRESNLIIVQQDASYSVY